MPRRPATVTQADVARALRAARQEGVEVRRIVIRSDGVSLELADEEPSPSVPVERRPRPVL